MSYVVLELRLLIIYFIYFKFTHYVFTSVKEKNRLISKGMCVLLFDVFNRSSLIQLRK